jgi:uncharacterized protein (TIGR02328 family)
MRLWSYQMLSVIPRQQILSQLRECVAIAKDISEKGTTNHILINNIMDYDLDHFRLYCQLVIEEMESRGYNVSDKTKIKLHDYVNYDKPIRYFTCGYDIYVVRDNEPNEKLFEQWHNDTYITICLWNLYEKALCQGVLKSEWEKLYDKFGWLME